MTSTGKKFAGLLLGGLLCLATTVGAETVRAQRKPKKPVLPPPLPSGPQGPVPQIPLDSIPAVAPQVIYQSGQLTILAPNSTLGDILRAVKKQTAADIDIPANANERVVTSLGPGPAREVVAELLNGSRFNYVLLGSPSDGNRLTRVVLVAKTGPDVVPNAAVAQEQPPAGGQPVNLSPQQDVGIPETQEAETADDTTMEDSNPPDQSATDVEQQQQQNSQDPAAAVKTPQQMLQEMQQRQLQLQQQMTPGQPPIPGAAIPQPPPHPQQQPPE